MFYLFLDGACSEKCTLQFTFDILFFFRTFRLIIRWMIKVNECLFDDYEKLPHAQKIGVDARLIRRELCSMLIPVISELIEATFDFIKEISDLNMETLTVFKLSKNGWEKT